jgi:hypothetical protein
MNLLVLPELYDLHRVLVLEVGCVTRFPFKTGNQVLVGGKVGMEGLDDYDAPQGGLHRAIHRAHGARAESLRYLESPQTRRNVHRVIIRGRRSDVAACFCADPLSPSRKGPRAVKIAGLRRFRNWTGQNLAQIEAAEETPSSGWKSESPKPLTCETR